MAIFPANIGSGLTFDAEVVANDYPAPAWTVSAVLAGVQRIELSAVGNGVQHEFHASAATTDDWAAGRYWYTVRATNGVDVVELETGQVNVLPNLASAPVGFNGQTDAEKALAAIDAVIAKRATLDQERYRINNRELYRTPIEELLRLRSFYVVQVQRERRQKSGNRQFGRRIDIRFSNQ